MVAPFDYSIGQGDANPFAPIMAGMQSQAQLADVQQKQAHAALYAQQQQDLIAKQQAAQQAAAQYAAEQQRFLSLASPTVADARRLMLSAPQDVQNSIAEMTKSIGQDAMQKNTQWSLGIMSALQTNPAFAMDQIEKHAAKLEQAEGGEGEAAALRQIKQSIETQGVGPALAFFTSIAAQTPGGKTAIDAMIAAAGESRAAGLYPSQLDEQKGKAQQAVIAGKYAEDAQKAQIAKDRAAAAASQQAIARDAVAIRKTEAEIKAAENDRSLDLQEKQLKIQELQNKVTATKQEATNDLATKTNVMDSLNQTAKLMLSYVPAQYVGKEAQYFHDMAKKGKMGDVSFSGAAVRSTGPLAGKTDIAGIGNLPTISEDSANFLAQLEATRGGVGLGQIGLLKGAASDKDILLVKNANNSLSTTQDRIALAQSIGALYDSIGRSAKTVQKAYQLGDITATSQPAPKPSTGKIVVDY